METVRKFFSTVTKRCCFSSEYSNPENLEGQEKSKLDATNSQISSIPKIHQKDVKVLCLVVIESEKMTIGKSYNVNPSGLVNSERNSPGDGCVYAGSLAYEDNKIVNDIILPQNEAGVGKKHFVIKYSPEKDSYSIKDLGDGMGTFIRLTRPLCLKSNFIISFGDSHLIVVIENNEVPKLVIRFIDGPKVEQKL
jgi:FHA domain